MSLPETFVEGFHDEEAVRKMEYLEFGRTGLKLSKVSFGGAVMASFYGEPNENEAAETMKESVRLGVNYIDTAPFYGQGRSEAVIGKALKTIPREAYYIATKVGRYNPPGTEGQFDFSAAKTRQSLEKSLELLGLESVDVVQMHDIDYEENLDAAIDECLPELEKLREEGKLRFIGITCYTLDVLKEAILRAPGRFDMILCYARYTLIDNAFESFVPFFQEQNVGMVCAAGHAQRLLTNIGPPSWHAASPELKRVVQDAREICIANKVELGNLAMYHFLQFKGPATFLVGMETRKLLKENLQALYEGLSARELQIYEQLKRNVFSKVKKGHWEGVEPNVYREFKKKSKYQSIK